MHSYFTQVFLMNTLKNTKQINSVVSKRLYGKIILIVGMGIAKIKKVEMKNSSKVQKLLMTCDTTFFSQRVDTALYNLFISPQAKL